MRRLLPLMLTGAAFALSATATPALAQPAPAPLPPSAPADAVARAELALGDYSPEPNVGVAHPDWARKAVIYQINTRQFTPEGTLKAATREIPRLKALGVDILWLMPIHPIGETNRKGTLGSPYSVRDYRAVSAELGTTADLKAFVAAAHGQGMKVILDWVANHTAWDNPLRAAHPDWYERDWRGRNHSTPWWDWSDIIDLNYDQVGLRRYMAASMLYWVQEVGIDGYRADVAGYVPIDFWADVRRDLSRVKPVWMLGEFNHRDPHFASFDASYAWAFAEALEKIAKGTADTGALYGYYSESVSAWPRGAQRMIWTQNHDHNSWHGTDRELFGAQLANARALTFLSEGIPLVYNGQEAGLDRRLKFFERDPIAWRDHPNAADYRRWIAFRKAHPALDNAPWGGTMVKVDNDKATKVFSFVRRVPGDAVLVIQNYDKVAQTVTLGDLPYPGQWQEMDGAVQPLATGSKLTLAPHSTRVFTRSA